MFRDASSRVNSRVGKSCHVMLSDSMSALQVVVDAIMYNTYEIHIFYICVLCIFFFPGVFFHSRFVWEPVLWPTTIFLSVNVRTTKKNRQKLKQTAVRSRILPKVGFARKLCDYYIYVMRCNIFLWWTCGAGPWVSRLIGIPTKRRHGRRPHRSSTYRLALLALHEYWRLCSHSETNTCQQKQRHDRQAHVRRN